MATKYAGTPLKGELMTLKWSTCGVPIILVAAAMYVGSVVFGSVGGLFRQMFPGRHLEA